MKYTEVSFRITPYNEIAKDILTALLAEIDYNTFTEEEEELKAYIPTLSYDASALEELASGFPFEETALTFRAEEMEDKDWNEEWEKNFFQPTLIGGRCVVHSSFHKDVPQAEYHILINPRMAFGTGHHETTSLIIEELLEADLKGKRVLDMGCGTSILAIMASMRGAKEITAIDIDDWCVDNSLDNLTLNHITNVEVKLGDASLLPTLAPFDVVIANINRNILLQDMDTYAQAMKPGAQLWMSGFYTEDIPLLRQKVESLGLRFLSCREKKNWAAVHFEK